MPSQPYNHRGNRLIDHSTKEDVHGEGKCNAIGVTNGVPMAQTGKEVMHPYE